MTEPVSVPARPRSPGHTLRLDAASATALSPRGGQLGTPGSDMSPSGCLCLLTILGLVLPARGQTLEETSSPPPKEPNTVDSHTSTQAPDAVHPDLPSTPQIPTPEAAVETTQNQNKTQTQQPMGTDVRLTTDPRTDVEGTTLPERLSTGKDIRMDPQPHKPAGSGEDTDNPFFYDEDTLRKRGLLVAAVLFIMGIVILTSGKCRHWSQLCRNYCR
ncbi:FXYD domain-containing ion transport regulator 5 [Choloepus didactylus]|uniref:FXYD domain-containing ion transport regulator 5 n=1 Tax=Choloepus didactylus TaxID=27675 RepID=UPI00189FAEB3|nr:FXYD domain-containing ion transport regulator 5 [Choloepus didactylus]